VDDGRKTHLVDGVGLLCGAKLTEVWVLDEARVTCPRCEALIAAREQEHRARTKWAIETLTQILKESEL
jgi:hypothetical protein